MKKLLLSFSGGETSAFMTKWCLENLQDQYEMKVVFANTGQEHEETLIFVERCNKEYNFNMVYVEAVVQHNERTGTKHKIVDFKTASRNGEPFEDVIKKYGIPNQAYPHCNRELKLAPIHHYIKSIGWKEYYTAIGIRADEPKRLNWEKAKEKKLIYPLATNIRVSKPYINNFFKNQPFRLNLKSYQGNCKTCWKKSRRKLWTIAVENPEWFKFFIEMENKYSFHLKKGRKEIENNKPIRFFRENESVADIFKDSKFKFELAKDDREDNNIQLELWNEFLDGNNGCVESCEMI